MGNHLQEGRFKKINQAGRTYLAEKIFAVGKPRPMVLAERIRQIKERIKKVEHLNHSNFLDYLELQEIDGDYYLLSREEECYLPLLQYLDIYRPTLDEIFDWMLELADLFDLAGENGIHWPGLTVESLQVNLQGELKLVDPLLAELTAPYSGNSRVPGFSQLLELPEQKEQMIDSQLQQTGQIFYYLITGQHPFAAGNPAESYAKKNRGTIIEPRLLNEEISFTLNNLLIGLIVPSVDGFKNWEEVADCLRGIKANGSIYSAEEERQKNQQKAARVLPFLYYREKIFAIFRGKSRIAALILLAVFSLTLLVVLDNSPVLITEETPPVQVAEYFYQAINEKNLDYLQQTTEQRLKPLEDLISRGHVLEKVGNAFSVADKNTAGRGLFGIEKLRLELTSHSAGQYIYQASYIFYSNKKGAGQEMELNDLLFLQRVERKWQIVQLKGDLLELMEGRVDRFSGQE